MSFMITSEAVRIRNELYKQEPHGQCRLNTAEAVRIRNNDSDNSSNQNTSLNTAEAVRIRNVVMLGGYDAEMVSKYRRSGAHKKPNLNWISLLNQKSKYCRSGAHKKRKNCPYCGRELV